MANIFVKVNLRAELLCLKEKKSTALHLGCQKIRERAYCLFEILYLLGIEFDELAQSAVGLRHEIYTCIVIESSSNLEHLVCHLWFYHGCIILKKKKKRFSSGRNF